MRRILILIVLLLVVSALTSLAVYFQLTLEKISEEVIIFDYSFIIWDFAISIVVIILVITIIKYKKKKKKKKEKKEKEEEEYFLPRGEEYRTEYY